MSAEFATTAADELSDFCGHLNTLESASERKEAIMTAYAWGLIDMMQTRLLIEAYQLETA